MLFLITNHKYLVLSKCYFGQRRTKNKTEIKNAINFYSEELIGKSSYDYLYYLLAFPWGHVSTVGYGSSFRNEYDFNDLFESIDNLEFITIQEYMNLQMNRNTKIYNKLGSDRDRSQIIYKNDKNKIVLFHKVVHLIS